MTNFIEILKKRRSIYALNSQLPLTSEEVEELVKEAVRLSPSAFNSQSSRVAFLWGEEKNRFWEFTEEILRPLTPEEAFSNTQKKLAGFRQAAAVIFFFEDQEVVTSLQKQFPLYEESFPDWSEQASGIAAVNAWCALSEVGIGCNLQHYNPVVDEQVAATWKFPASWKLRGQLVIGGIVAPAGEKEFIPDEKRFQSFGRKK